VKFRKKQLSATFIFSTAFFCSSHPLRHQASMSTPSAEKRRRTETKKEKQVDQSQPASPSSSESSDSSHYSRDYSLDRYPPLTPYRKPKPSDDLVRLFFVYTDATENFYSDISEAQALEWCIDDCADGLDNKEDDSDGYFAARDRILHHLLDVIPHDERHSCWSVYKEPARKMRMVFLDNTIKGIDAEF
jgi:hypothetical protein